MTKITAPVEGYSGSIGAVEFVDGVAHTVDEAVIAYCRDAGYGIGSGKPDVPEAPEPPDPRELENGGIAVVGTRLRDAAVDPKDSDFLPPTNAGKANPHGSEVVAPGIHAVETQVVRAGAVASDAGAQSAAETKHAAALLGGQQVTKVVGVAVPDLEARGPLGLSDPGSAAVGAAQANDDGAAADASLPEVPAGNASKDAWREYALATGAAEADIEDLTRDELRDRYTPKG